MTSNQPTNQQSIPSTLVTSPSLSLSSPTDPLDETSQSFVDVSPEVPHSSFIGHPESGPGPGSRSRNGELPSLPPPQPHATSSSHHQRTASRGGGVGGVSINGSSSGSSKLDNLLRLRTKSKSPPATQHRGLPTIGGGGGSNNHTTSSSSSSRLGPSSPYQYQNFDAASTTTRAGESESSPGLLVGGGGGSSPNLSDRDDRSPFEESPDPGADPEAYVDGEGDGDWADGGLPIGDAGFELGSGTEDEQKGGLEQQSAGIKNNYKQESSSSISLSLSKDKERDKDGGDGRAGGGGGKSEKKGLRKKTSKLFGGVGKDKKGKSSSSKDKDKDKSKSRESTPPVKFTQPQPGENIERKLSMSSNTTTTSSSSRQSQSQTQSQGSTAGSPTLPLVTPNQPRSSFSGGHGRLPSTSSGFLNVGSLRSRSRNSNHSKLPHPSSPPGERPLSSATFASGDISVGSDNTVGDGRSFSVDSDSMSGASASGGAGAGVGGGGGGQAEGSHHQQQQQHRNGSLPTPPIGALDKGPLWARASRTNLAPSVSTTGGGAGLSSRMSTWFSHILPTNQNQNQGQGQGQSGSSLSPSATSTNTTSPPRPYSESIIDYPKTSQAIPHSAPRPISSQSASHITPIIHTTAPSLSQSTSYAPGTSATATTNSPNRAGKIPSSATNFFNAARQKAVGGVRYLLDSEAQPDGCEETIWVMGVAHNFPPPSPERSISPAFSNQSGNMTGLSPESGKRRASAQLGEQEMLGSPDSKSGQSVPSGGRFGQLFGGGGGGGFSPGRKERPGSSYSTTVGDSPSKSGGAKLKGKEKEKEPLRWPDDFLEDFRSTIWCTYRSQYAPILSLTPNLLLVTPETYTSAELPPLNDEVKSNLTPQDTPNLSASQSRSGWSWVPGVATGNAERGLTTDAGWGCMLRTGQSMLANALIHLHLGRDWRRPTAPPTPDDIQSYAAYVQILNWFMDDPSATCPFSVHRMALIGKELGKEVGEWFGPSTAAGAIRTLTNNFSPCGLAVSVASDGIVFQSEVYAASNQDSSSWSGISQKLPLPPRPVGKGSWGGKAVLVLAGIRLGLDGVNPLYYDSIKTIFAFPQSVGIAGGRPSSSYYFVGTQANTLFYLDPHFTRPAIPLNTRRGSRDPNSDTPAHDTSDEAIFLSQAYSPAQLNTFHCEKVKKMDYKSLDPSMLLGFLCKDEQDWEDLVERVGKDEPPSWGSDSDDAGMESFSETDPGLESDEHRSGAGHGSDDEDDDDMFRSTSTSNKVRKPIPQALGLGINHRHDVQSLHDDEDEDSDMISPSPQHPNFPRSSSSKTATTRSGKGRSMSEETIDRLGGFSGSGQSQTPTTESGLSKFPSMAEGGLNGEPEVDEDDDDLGLDLELEEDQEDGDLSPTKNGKQPQQRSPPQTPTKPSSNPNTNRNSLTSLLESQSSTRNRTYSSRTTGTNGTNGTSQTLTQTPRTPVVRSRVSSRASGLGESVATLLPGRGVEAEVGNGDVDELDEGEGELIINPSTTLSAEEEEDDEAWIPATIPAPLGLPVPSNPLESGGHHLTLTPEDDYLQQQQTEHVEGSPSITPEDMGEGEFVEKEEVLKSISPTDYEHDKGSRLNHQASFDSVEGEGELITKPESLSMERNKEGLSSSGEVVVTRPELSKEDAVVVVDKDVTTPSVASPGVLDLHGELVPGDSR